MKRLFGLLLLIAACASSASAQNKPDWVKKHPVYELGYAGVGMSYTSEPDYRQKAKQSALADLVSEIKIEVSANSLLHSLSVNGVSQQTFMEDVRITAQAEIEKFRLADSWEGNGEYWVYYTLNRLDYEAYVEARRQKAMRNAADYWDQGNRAMVQGNLNTGLALFIKAMETIEPVSHEELLYTHGGKTINLGVEIYTSLSDVFDGIALHVDPVYLEATPFQNITELAKITVARREVPLANVHLLSRFISGGGDLAPIMPTDEAGVANLHVRSVTSKQSSQQVLITIDDAPFKSFLKSAYAVLFAKALTNLPQATLTIEVKQAVKTAYVRSKQSNMEAVERSVKSLLANNYFDVVDSPERADIIVTLDNSFRTGRTVPGDLYNFVECFTTLGIRLTDHHSRKVLLNYNVTDLRTLVPADKSVAQGKSMATRELMKRVNREFPAELKKMSQPN
ncbi:MAG: LPP20 family lipoprotein [Mediterranea sp.]|jgi:hypothetical protein|nr:LPP20 family lipoprotein [Mediterranea sp.]